MENKCQRSEQLNHSKTTEMQILHEKSNWWSNKVFLPPILLVGEFPVTSPSLPFGHDAVFAATVISMLQGIPGYKDKALQNIRSNFAGVTVNEPDMMDTCIRHKGKYRHAVIWESGNAPLNTPFTRSLNWKELFTWHHFPKTNSTADNNQPTQFSSLLDMVTTKDETELKL